MYVHLLEMVHPCMSVVQMYARQCCVCVRCRALAHFVHQCTPVFSPPPGNAQKCQGPLARLREWTVPGIVRVWLCGSSVCCDNTLVQHKQTPGLVSGLYSPPSSYLTFPRRPYGLILKVKRLHPKTHSFPQWAEEKSPLQQQSTSPLLVTLVRIMVSPHFP